MKTFDLTVLIGGDGNWMQVERRRIEFPGIEEFREGLTVERALLDGKQASLLFICREVNAGNGQLTTDHGQPAEISQKQTKETKPGQIGFNFQPSTNNPQP